MHCKKASIQKVKHRILNRDDFIVANKVRNEEKEAFLLKENERAEDFLCEATIIHKVLAKNLWQSKIWKESNLMFSNTSFNSIKE